MSILYPWTLSVSEQHYLEVELLDLRLYKVFIFYRSGQNFLKKSVIVSIYIHHPTREKENKSQRCSVVNNLVLANQILGFKAQHLCGISVKSGQLV